MDRALWIATTCLAAAVAGWIAIVLVAVLAPGGHPPLSAYVAVPILLASLPLGAVGAGMAAWSLRRGRASPWLASIVLIGNGLIAILAAAKILEG